MNFSADTGNTMTEFKEMKRFMILLAGLLLTIPALTQELDKKEQRKLEKELRKEQKAEEAATRAAVVGLMVEHGRFVLEAEQLRDRRGNTVNVTSMINFIASDSIRGVIQIGNNSYVGLNGVGGITVEGRVTNYRYTFNGKNGSYQVTYILRSPTGTYDVQMSVSSNGRADATVSSNWPGRVNYIGTLVPPASSRVYKGTTSY
jgi:hypothetical protein